MITIEQAVECHTFYHVSEKNADGSAVRCRRNGQTKTWKRDEFRFRIPVKYGLYNCFYIESDRNAMEWVSTMDPSDLNCIRSDLRLKKEATLEEICSALTEEGLEDIAQAVRNHNEKEVKCLK